MRGKIIAALAAALLTVTAGVVAQTSGFPSRPIFQLVTSGTPSSATATVIGIGSGATRGQVATRGNASGVTNVSYVEFQNSTGTQIGYVGDGSTGNDDIIIGAAQAGGNIRFYPDAAGNVYLRGGSTPAMFGRVAYGRINGSGSGCPLDATKPNTGISGCVRNSAGRYAVLVNAGFTVTPICTATGNDSILVVVSVVTFSATTIDLYVNNTSGALDSPVFLNCIGT